MKIFIIICFLIISIFMSVEGKDALKLKSRVRKTFNSLRVRHHMKVYKYQIKFIMIFNKNVFI